ncbi:sulfite exporter TauE/SafE family protein [Elioraea sp. Yellowstone]|jgi:uncharacterized membrane protein YfcA|uniref:sulfite exporter TauE/SafE family protein n=1 Tax=Elioraea sp. Yellowstone TaxID=2592070 RepID=UPI001152F26B|nr:sulfite exporter TauE/SafE family protein [Elioraea sp. Yellowstone]TQF77223.1 sulfite exporter TauE/SafE family protein [Elioraea sp. Yellowstone]
MLTLSAGTIALVSLGAFIGAISAGAAGFAFAMTASAIWLHVMDPVRSALLVVASGGLLHTILVWRMRATIDRARLAPFLIGGLIGVPVGVALLTVVDTALMRRMLGGLMAAYGGYALLAPSLPRVTAGGRRADAAVGLVGGVMSGLGGYSGVPTTIWAQLRGWPKELARGVYQPFILAMHIATLVLVGGLAFDRTSALLLAITLPALLLGGWLGYRLYGHLNERQFRRLLAAMIAASGIALLI